MSTLLIIFNIIGLQVLVIVKEILMELNLFKNFACTCYFVNSFNWKKDVLATKSELLNGFIKFIFSDIYYIFLFIPIVNIFTVALKDITYLKYFGDRILPIMLRNDLCTLMDDSMCEAYSSKPTGLTAALLNGNYCYREGKDYSTTDKKSIGNRFIEKFVSSKINMMIDKPEEKILEAPVEEQHVNDNQIRYIDSANHKPYKRIRSLFNKRKK